MKMGTWKKKKKNQIFRCASPFATAAYPAAYAPISQAFPQQPTIIPQQQREGKSEQAHPPKIKGDNCHVPF